MKLDLHSGSDAYNFYEGQPMRWIRGGQVVPMGRARRVLARLSSAWFRMTRWWRPRTVVAAIDVERGAITLTTELWSWRRWRWERP